MQMQSFLKTSGQFEGDAKNKQMIKKKRPPEGSLFKKNSEIIW